MSLPVALRLLFPLSLFFILFSNAYAGQLPPIIGYKPKHNRKLNAFSSEAGESPIASPSLSQIPQDAQPSSTEDGTDFEEWIIRWRKSKDLEANIQQFCAAEGFSCSDHLKRVRMTVVSSTDIDKFFDALSTFREAIDFVQVPQIYRALTSRDLLSKKEKEAAARSLTAAPLLNSRALYSGPENLMVEDRWHLDRVDQAGTDYDQVYSYYNRGENTHVYVFDSGITKEHIEFNDEDASKGSRIVEALTFISSKFGDDYDNPWDYFFHGTHVSGLAAGLNVGVAGKALIHSYKVLGSGGAGNTIGVAKAIDYAMTQHEREHAGDRAVFIFSLGGNFVDYTDVVMETVVTEATAAGFSVSVAAGNRAVSNSCRNTPAFIPDSTVVAASNSLDSFSSFTSIGSCVDIFAPGTSIVSAKHDTTDEYVVFSGTSMATPIVAGAIATLYSADPLVTPAAATRIVSNSGAQVIRPPTSYIIPESSYLLSSTPRKLLQTRPLQYRPLRVTKGHVALDETNKASFGVYLAWEPTSSVTVKLSVSKAGKRTGLTQLTFTPKNWMKVQTVTISTARREKDQDVGGKFFVDLEATSASFPVPVHHSVQVDDARVPTIGSTFRTPLKISKLPFTFEGNTGAYSTIQTALKYDCTNTKRDGSLNTTAVFFELDLTKDCRGGRKVRNNQCAFEIAACKSMIKPVVSIVPLSTMEALRPSQKLEAICSPLEYDETNVSSECTRFTELPSFIKASLSLGQKYIIILHNLLESIEGPFLLEAAVELPGIEGTNIST